MPFLKSYLVCAPCPRWNLSKYHHRERGLHKDPGREANAPGKPTRVAPLESSSQEAVVKTPFLCDGPLSSINAGAFSMVSLYRFYTSAFGEDQSEEEFLPDTTSVTLDNYTYSSVVIGWIAVGGFLSIWFLIMGAQSVPAALVAASFPLLLTLPRSPSVSYPTRAAAFSWLFVLTWIHLYLISFLPWMFFVWGRDVAVSSAVMKRVAVSHSITGAVNAWSACVKLSAVGNERWINDAPQFSVWAHWTWRGTFDCLTSYCVSDPNTCHG